MLSQHILHVQKDKQPLGKFFVSQKSNIDRAQSTGGIFFMTLHWSLAKIEVHLLHLGISLFLIVQLRKHSPPTTPGE